MAHEYKEEAKASHEKKLKLYGKEDEVGKKAKNWAGFDALNTNEQRGLKPIDKEPELSKDTAPRIMRKKGGRVHGAESLKRLDKAPRKGKQMGGPMGMPSMAPAMAARPVPTPMQASAIANRMQPSIVARKKGGKVEEHPDEREDRALVKKMVKEDALTGKSRGGMARKKYADGGLPSPEEAMRSAQRLKELRSMPTPNRRSPPMGSGVPSADRNALGNMLRAPTSADYRKGNLGDGEYAMKRGGRAKRADGGMLGMGEHGKSSKKGGGKTTVNIIIGAPKGSDAGQQGAFPPPMMAGSPPSMAPPSAPPMGAGPQLPPNLAGGPPMAPPMGGALPAIAAGMPQGGPPIPRKDGGTVKAGIQVPYKKPKHTSEGYLKMDFGAGTGFGRMQKGDAYGAKPIKSRDNY